MDHFKFIDYGSDEEYFDVPLRITDDKYYNTLMNEDYQYDIFNFDNYESLKFIDDEYAYDIPSEISLKLVDRDDE